MNKAEKIFMTKDDIINMYFSKVTNKSNNYQQINSNVFDVEDHTRYLIHYSYGVLPFEHIQINGIELDNKDFILLHEFLTTNNETLFHRWERVPKSDKIKLVFSDKQSLDIINQFLKLEDKEDIYDFNIEGLDGLEKYCIFLDSYIEGMEERVLDLPVHSRPSI